MSNKVQWVIDTYVAPASAFATIAERPAWSWLALLLIAVTGVASVYALLGGASPEWIVEQQLLEVSDLTPDEMETARTALIEVAPYAVHLGAAMQVVLVPIVSALLALLYFVGERVVGPSRRRFGQWFALSALSLMPLVINALGLVALCLLQPGEKPLQLANYASLNSLVLDLSPGERGQGLAAALNLFYLWSIGLAAIGIRVYTGYGWAKSIVLAAFPYLLVFGTWTLFL